MIDRDRIETLIPHAGDMCLWDEVVDWTANEIRLRARGHRDPAHPLRARGQLHAVHLCEYGAQAMAVHGGLRAQAGDEAVRPGLLVALRDVTLHVTRIDDLPGPLECTAQVLVESDSSQQYSFSIHHVGTLLAEGRAVVMLQHDPDARPL